MLPVNRSNALTQEIAMLAVPHGASVQITPLLDQSLVIYMCNVIITMLVRGPPLRTAPYYGDLIVNCSGGQHGDACLSITVNASHMITGSLYYKSTFGAGTRHVHCPGNGNECNIQCEGSNACKTTSIYSSKHTNLNIIASGDTVLSSSHIYCPSESGQCSLTVLGNGRQMLTNARIYVVKGLRDISLVCNYSVNVSTNCYDTRCEIEIISGNDEWECIYDRNNTALCTDTSKPDGFYGSPFICNAGSECRDLPIVCDEDSDCRVDCSGSSSCRNGHIKAPIRGNL
eukprot:120060_1